MTETTQIPVDVFICPADHKHGETRNCYGHHKCRCDDCKAFNNRAANRRRRDIAYGRYDRQMVPSAGTKRRIQALVHAGWAMSVLSRRAGLTRCAFDRLLNSDMTMPNTVKRVNAIYDELWDQQPPALTARDKQSVSRTKRWARQQRFYPALAWDDDTIDDPSAEPSTGEAPAGFLTRNDPQVVQDAIDGLKPLLSPVERRLVVARLNENRWSARRIAEYVGSDPRTVTRIRTELNLPAYDQVTIRDQNWKAA